MTKNRLDNELFKRNLVASRSQAENLIKLGLVKVDNVTITKPGYLVNSANKLSLIANEHYVSRAALKLQSAAKLLNLDFNNKIVLDVGSSTGGFTQFALKKGAKKVISVDVGTNQMHPSLVTDERVELHEKTDIREFKTNEKLDYVLIDVSFISLRLVLPSLTEWIGTDTRIVAMVKPQFETESKNLNKGIVKNDSIRRKILNDFESWAKLSLVITEKADSKIAGAKGNLERFYLLKTIANKNKNL